MITEYDEIKFAFSKAEHFEGAFPTSRVLQWEQDNCQEWCEYASINGKRSAIYYIFENSECECDCDEYPWDAEHVSKIEILDSY